MEVWLINDLNNPKLLDVIDKMDLGFNAFEV
jgi:hypothetical protein